MYDALIIVNGEIAPRDDWQDLRYRTLICTDGAVLTLQDLELTPDIIIGDMDSISEGIQNATVNALQMRFPKSKIELIVDQETTDFEKALIYSKENHYQRVLCLGTLGKSADHSFHNLVLLNRYSQSLDLMLLHTFGSSKQWVFSLPSQISIYTQKECLISFFPLPEATLTTQGLKWELNGEQITQKGKSGVRNITRENTINVKCEGQCICFLTAPAPPDIRSANHKKS